MSADLFVAASVDLSDVEQGLAAASRASLAPAFKALKKPLREDQREHGKRQRGPIAAWARRSRKTLEYYRSHSGRRQRATLRSHGARPRYSRPPRPLGKLLTGISYKADAHSVTGTSKIPFSEAQQDGGTVGHGAKLKARPFLYLSTKLLELAEDTFARTFLDAYGGNK